MVMRLASGEAIPLFQILISLVLLAATAWGTLRLVSVAFDAGLLAQGGRMTWGTIFRRTLARR